MSEARAETREAVEGVRRGVAERTQVDAALAGVETRLNARVDQQVGRVLLEMDARRSVSDLGQLVS